MMMDTDPDTVPVADAGANQYVPEGATVTLDGQGSSDPEGEDLSYAWTKTAGPYVALTGANTANPRFTVPDMVDTPLFTFSLIVTNAQNQASAPVSVIIYIRPFLTDTVEDQTYTVGVTIPDMILPKALGREKIYTLTPVPAGLEFNAATRTLSGTPSAAGQTALTYTATFPNVGVDTLIFSITVRAAENASPTANAGADQTVTEGIAVRLRGSGSDPEGEELTYAWTQTSGDTVQLNQAATADTGFAAPTQLIADATLMFTLTVTDARGASATDTVRVTVRAGANDAPTANAGADQTVTEGIAVRLRGSGTDPEGEALTYAWTQTSGDTVQLNQAATADMGFAAPTQLVADATLMFSMTVTDAHGASATDTVRVTVTAGANDAPTANAGVDQTVTEGIAVRLRGSGTDPEGEALTYAWTQTSGDTVQLNQAATADTGFAAPTQLVADARLMFTLTVTDARGAIATDTVRVTVTAGANDAPTANAGVDQTVTEGIAVTLRGSGSDPEGEELTYAWTQTSGDTVQLNQAATADTDFTAPTQLVADATLMFTMTVTDARGAIAIDTVSVTVTAGAPPLLWPDYMPAPVTDQISIGAPQGAVLRTNMDAGPAKQRKRFTAAPRPVALVFQPVSTDKLTSFDAFYVNKLAYGALGFEMRHPITDQLRQFRFVANEDPWQVTAIGKDSYSLSVTLEVLP